MKPESYAQAVGRYLIGAVVATGLTLLAYFSVTESWFDSLTALVCAIMVFAAIQLTVQLYTFLHVGADKKPRLRNMSFAFTALMLVVVVVGSLWIMYHLNYRMGMSPEAMQEYMLQQNKEGF